MQKNVFLLYEPLSTNTNDLFSSFGQLVSILFVFLFVAILAYFSTKWIAQAKFLKKTNGNLTLIESVGVGFSNSVALVKVGEKYIAIAVSKERVTYLSEIPKEDINETPIVESAMTFDAVLSRLKNKKD